MSATINDLNRRMLDDGKTLWCVAELFLTDEEKRIIGGLPIGDPDNMMGQIVSAGISALYDIPEVAKDE